MVFNMVVVDSEPVKVIYGIKDVNLKLFLDDSQAK